MKIIHIIGSNPIVNDAIVEMFERLYPSQNIYLLPDESMWAKMKEQNAEKICKTNDLQGDVKKIIAQIPDAICFIHGVTVATFPLLAPENGIKIPIIGIFWGDELNCGRPLCNLDTLLYAADRKSILKTLLSHIPFFRWLHYRELFKNFARLNYVGEILPGEYKMILQDYFPAQYRAKCFDFNYLGDDVVFAPPVDAERVGRKNILVGHSANLANNHISIYKRLAKFDLEDRKVISSFGYGTLSQAPKMVLAGKRLLGEHFVPLNRVLPLDEYQTVLESCGFAVFGCLRQMALGNIILLLNNGTKIFFFQKSPLYILLKNMGFIIFTIENELRPGNQHCFQPLTEAEAQHNHELILHYYSKDIVDAKAKVIVEYLRNRSQKALISIIIPCYNPPEKLLRRCLDSLCAQTMRELEFIIIDDASVDSSIVPILYEYAAKEPRMQIILLEQNVGSAAARNAGLAKATGDYIGFVDADDWIEPEMFAKLYAAAVSSRADITVCNFRSVSLAGEVTHPFMRSIRHRGKTPLLAMAPDCNYYGLAQRSTPLVWNKLFRNHKVPRFGEKIKYAQDAAFVTEYMAGHATIAFINDVLYSYVEHPVSATRNKDWQNIQNRLSQCLNKIEYFISHIYQKADSFRSRRYCAISTWLGMREFFQVLHEKNAVLTQIEMQQRVKPLYMLIRNDLPWWMRASGCWCFYLGKKRGGARLNHWIFRIHYLLAAYCPWICYGVKK